MSWTNFVKSILIMKPFTGFGTEQIVRTFDSMDP